MTFSLVLEHLLLVFVGIVVVVVASFGWFGDDGCDTLTDPIINDRLRQFLGAGERCGF